MSNRIAIVIGHGPLRDKGAENAASKVTELDWNRDLATRIVKAIAGRSPVSIIHRKVEGHPPVEEVNTGMFGCCVELHLNANGGKASGTEMIYWLTSRRGKVLAALLLDAAVATLGLPNRGIKGPQGGGRGSAFLRGTNCPAVIVESFFIDNDGDLATGTAKRDALAKAYADALIKF